MPDIENNFRKNLIKYLNETNTTQEELAKYIGVGVSAVSNYVQGLNMPRMNKIDKICEFFKIKRTDLLESDEDDISEDKELMLLARDINDLSDEERELIINMIKHFRSK
ncbi:helix-turn-helix domain-containing protein [Ezakiella coagulans]|uniref:helix-turn-helix domain-containing protein n=1 Tax=Ezakiella coagulans TaxID=46507 RepID=UPI00288A2535|nr:helix-turn-helix transcriptional regulator [Ezakiella coagulans]